MTVPTAMTAMTAMTVKNTVTAMTSTTSTSTIIAAGTITVTATATILMMAMAVRAMAPVLRATPALPPVQGTVTRTAMDTAMGCRRGGGARASGAGCGWRPG